MSVQISPSDFMPRSFWHAFFEGFTSQAVKSNTNDEKLKDLRPAQPQLSRTVTEIPQIIADQQQRKVALYNLASTVCLVALVAIAAGVLAISIGFLSPLPTVLALALILSAFPLQMGVQTFMMKSSHCWDAARQATDRAKELDRIRHWKDPQIKAFFKEHHLSFEKLPMDLLRQVNPKEPLRALLPAIASYNYLCQKAQTQFSKHVDNLHNSIEDPTLHYQERLIGWHILEYNAIPTALQAALVLQTISQPTLQLELDDLGACHAKEFDQRRFDQLLDGNDEYFVFKDEKRPALTFTAAQEMVSKQDFDGLRVKLFS
jgi:hypothetical protein